MVTLNRIYTRTGDAGSTRLATGQPVSKSDPRVEAYGAVDETNAAIGLARLHTQADPELDAMLGRIQNDLFDLGADLATPERDKPLGWTPLRILPEQATRLEREIDALNADIPPLDSFILPGGSALAANLHLARTVSRRAERLIAQLAATPDEKVSAAALVFANRLSDFLFVAGRRANANGADDVKWVPGANRSA
ncbi:cob(I)yrinic acid a,c-diamide adenosyltransferase [Phenylobacterium sp.]|uniref:cob(I)yrinic acid a,c-diamide adenosyltransferase n=1 Tax=Phenylobacterium sp. TaxID=1871053 RepID=UPI00301BB3E1